MSFRVIPHPIPAPVPAVSAREAAEHNPVWRTAPAISLCPVCRFEREREDDRWTGGCLRPECEGWLGRRVAA